MFNFCLLGVEQVFIFLLFFLPNPQVRMVTNEPNIVDFCTNIGESCTNIVKFCTNIGEILSKLGGILSFFTLAMVLFQV